MNKQPQFPDVYSGRMQNSTLAIPFKDHVEPQKAYECSENVMAATFKETKNDLVT